MKLLESCYEDKNGPRAYQQKNESVRKDTSPSSNNPNNPDFLFIKMNRKTYCADRNYTTLYFFKLLSPTKQLLKFQPFKISK